jgi:hypothetical protein
MGHHGSMAIERPIARSAWRVAMIVVFGPADP